MANGVDEMRPASTDLSTQSISLAVFGAFNRLVSGMNSLGTIGIAVLMALICIDVFMRTVASMPLVGIPELVRVCIVSIVFLQVSHTLAVGRFTVSEVLLDIVDKKSPVAAKVMRGVYSLLGATLFACVTIGCYGQFIRNWEGSDFIGSQGIFTVPLWPMKAVVAFGSGVLTIQFIVNAIRYFRGESIVYDEVEIEVKNDSEGTA